MLFFGLNWLEKKLTQKPEQNSEIARFRRDFYARNYPIKPAIPENKESKITSEEKPNEFL